MFYYRLKKPHVTAKGGPVIETREVIANTREKNLIDPQTRQELIKWYDTITQQNYFTDNAEILIQKDGLAMGAPTSGLIAELFLQHLEHLHLDHLSYRHKIIGYFRHVDDILLIYDPSHMDIQNI